jgi:glutamate/aspartate transport system permease protein
VNYNWNWAVFFQTSPDGVHTYLATLILGTGWTLATALAAWCLALVFGSIVGVIRTTPHPWLVRLGNAYVELFRDIPLLVQMFLWYFVLPELLPADLGDWLKQLPNASFYTAVVALGFYTSARVAEQVRAGIMSLAGGQRMAALALGLTLPQAYGYVLLPLAYRIILPPLTSEFLNVIKNSAVALTIGLMELTARARAMQEFTFQVFEAFTAATVIYIVINIAVTFAMRRVERRVAVPGMIGTAPQDVHADPDRARNHRRHRFRHPARAHAALRHRAAGAAGRRLYQPDAVGAAGADDLLVLFPGAVYRAMDDRRVAADPGGRVRLLARHLHAVRGRVFRRDHAGRHPVDLAWPGGGGAGARHDLPADHGLHRAAAGLPQHGAGAAHPDHHPVSGYLAGLRALDHRLSRRRLEGGAA